MLATDILGLLVLAVSLLCLIQKSRQKNRDADLSESLKCEKYCVSSQIADNKEVNIAS